MNRILSPLNQRRFEESRYPINMLSSYITPTSLGRRKPGPPHAGRQSKTTPMKNITREFTLVFLLIGNGMMPLDEYCDEKLFSPHTMHGIVLLEDERDIPPIYIRWCCIKSDRQVMRNYNFWADNLD